MNQIYIPEGYKPPLGSYETQRAIAYIKKAFHFVTSLYYVFISGITLLFKNGKFTYTYTPADQFLITEEVADV